MTCIFNFALQITAFKLSVHECNSSKTEMSNRTFIHVTSYGHRLPAYYIGPITFFGDTNGPLYPCNIAAWQIQTCLGIAHIHRSALYKGLCLHLVLFYLFLSQIEQNLCKCIYLQIKGLAPVHVQMYFFLKWKKVLR